MLVDEGAADHCAHRYVSGQAVVDHLPITSGNALVCQVQVAQRILLVHVHAGVVKHQIRLVKRQEVVQHVVDDVQIAVVIKMPG